MVAKDPRYNPIVSVVDIADQLEDMRRQGVQLPFRASPETPTSSSTSPRANGGNTPTGRPEEERGKLNFMSFFTISRVNKGHGMVLFIKISIFLCTFLCYRPTFPRDGDDETPDQPSSARHATASGNIETSDQHPSARHTTAAAGIIETSRATHIAHFSEG